MYKRRYLSDKIKKALSFFPVVALVGARQTGKTTLVKEEFPDRTYLSLDSLDIRSAIIEDPVGFLSAQKGPIIVDEAQKAPCIFEAIKILVDRDREPGRFLLTGSANFLLLQKVSETLAGRIATFELSGFMVCEALEYPVPIFLQSCLYAGHIDDLLDMRPNQKDVSIDALILRGGLPPAVLSPNAEVRDMWLENYVATYLERDLRDLSQVASLGDFRRLMGLSAMRSAQLLNISELARDAGLSTSTARNYIQLLEVSYQIRRLPPYYANIGKRLVKAPKLHFRDTAVAMTVSGLSRNTVIQARHPYRSALFESFIVEEIARLLGLLGEKARMFHYRSHSGAEVDLVIELGERLLPIEIKSSATVSTRKLGGLRQFLKDFHGKAPFGLVIYDGVDLLPISRDILLVPWNVII